MSLGRGVIFPLNYAVITIFFFFCDVFYANLNHGLNTYGTCIKYQQYNSSVNWRACKLLKNRKITPNRENCKAISFIYIYTYASSAEREDWMYILGSYEEKGGKGEEDC